MFNAFSVLIVECLKVITNIFLIVVSLQMKNGFNIEDFSLSDLDPLAK